MKSFPSTILKEIEKKYEDLNPILFYGNEEGLISGLIKSIYNILEKKIEISGIKYFDHKNNKDEEFENILKDSSLFSKIIFIVLKNPQERLVAELKNYKKINNILIISGENIATKSKIKSYFDSHQSFISVPCYSLGRNCVIKKIDIFVKNNNIVLNKEAYWFLIDNISENYLTLENELQKLYVFKNSSADIKNLQKLIIPKKDANADNYFFYCASGNFKMILQNIHSSNKSMNESYEILVSLKKLINVLISATLNKNSCSLDELVETYLPRYLYLKKEIFREILKKTNLSKINKINKMLQKTEYLLRKNANQHSEIIERLLLNLVKIMK